jgi:peroxiredoxin
MICMDVVKNPNSINPGGKEKKPLLLRRRTHQLFTAIVHFAHTKPPRVPDSDLAICSSSHSKHRQAMASAIASRVSAAGACARTVTSRTGAASLAVAGRAQCYSTHSLSSVAWFGSRRFGLKQLGRHAAARAGAGGVVVATIAVGDKLPEAQLSYFDAEGNAQAVTVSELTKGKKVVLFAVPGAFTPTCSSKHLPGFVAKAAELRAAGVDTLACVSVNDAFVMQAWGKSAGVGANVLMLSDGLGKFTQALGTAVDLSDKREGLGLRSRRFSMLVEDGVVKTLNLEEGGAFTSSSAEEILSSLQKASV